MEIFLLFVSGCGGALVKDILNDGYITLPRLDSGKLYMGFVGSIFIGGTVGVIVDNSFITAFLAGYVGFAVVEGLISKKFPFVNGQK